VDERWIATAKRRQPMHRRSAEARERRVYFFSVALIGTPVGDAASREIQNAAAAATTRNIKMPAIIHKFTFVVGGCTFTSGKPLLFFVDRHRAPDSPHLRWCPPEENQGRWSMADMAGSPSPQSHEAG